MKRAKATWLSAYPKAVTMKLIVYFFTIVFLASGFQMTSAQESSEDVDKSKILEILEDGPNENSPALKVKGNTLPWFSELEIFKVFDVILQNDSLRQDINIRASLQHLSETHPFTYVRASALLVLSGFDGDRIPPMFHFGQTLDGYKGPAADQINESMEYCAPPIISKRPDFELKAEQEAKGHGKRPQYRFKVPMKYGTITGGYYKLRGVGLSYAPNVAPDKPITISYGNNRYIMASDKEGEYWLIDGPHHLAGGASILRLVETKNGVERYLHRVLPSEVSQIFELEDGRVFINFVSLDPSKRSGGWKDDVFTPSPLSRYNPPIFIYPDGGISLACEPNARKF